MKKIICILMLISCVTLCVCAADTAEQAPQMPQEGMMPGGGRGGRMPPGDMPQDGEMPQMPQDGEMPQMPQDGEVPQMPQDGEMQGGDRGGMGGMMPDGMAQESIQNDAQNQNDFVSFLNKYQTATIAVVLLVFGFGFVILYKRKSF